MAARMAKERLVVLGLLLLLLAGSGGLLVFALFATEDLEASLVESEVHSETAAVRMRLRRQRARRETRGELVALPRTAADVRAMVAFCRTAGGGDVVALREIALHDDDTLAAANAVRALGRLCTIAKDPELAALVNDPRARVRDETILALGMGRTGAALDILEPLVRCDDEHVRALAIRAAGQVGGSRACSLLTEIAARPDVTPLTAAFVRDALGTAER